MERYFPENPSEGEVQATLWRILGETNYEESRQKARTGYDITPSSENVLLGANENAQTESMEARENYHPVQDQIMTDLVLENLLQEVLSHALGDYQSDFEKMSSEAKFWLFYSTPADRQDILFRMIAESSSAKEYKLPGEIIENSSHDQNTGKYFLVFRPVSLNYIMAHSDLISEQPKLQEKIWQFEKKCKEQ